MIGMAYSSDKFQERTYHAIAGATFCLIGYVILTTLTARSALYAGICIVVAGVHTINPIMNAWLTSNIAPEMKRSVAAAMAVSANNSAGKYLYWIHGFRDVTTTNRPFRSTWIEYLSTIGCATLS